MKNVDSVNDTLSRSIGLSTVAEASRSRRRRLGQQMGTENKQSITESLELMV
jgi:hypothetical protein